MRFRLRRHQGSSSGRSYCAARTPGKINAVGPSTRGALMTSQADSHLSRNLRDRHIQLIALGGTIGVGLFLGSAKAIQKAGPGLLLAYAIGGIAVFLIMRALGELLTYRPVAGSFAVYADEFCGHF